MEGAFTLTVDWLAFTVPDASPEEVMQTVGRNWSVSETGFRGYPKCWISVDGSRGLGKLGTGAPRRPREVHADLSSGLVSTESLEKIRDVLHWIRQRRGHITRLDCALDDRHASVSVETIKHAVDAGQVVTRAEKFQAVTASSVSQGTSTGVTLYFGSGQSQTLLRVYDKRLELQQKRRNDWQDYGVRWELQLRKERADACASALLWHGLVADWREFVVGVLRAYVDFRDTTREASQWERYRAPLLPWWERLTEGLTQCRLHVEKDQRTLDQVKDWAVRSLAPMLAVLKEAAGPGWMESLYQSGKHRWQDRHRRLLSGERPTTVYALKPESKGNR